MLKASSAEQFSVAFPALHRRSYTAAFRLLGVHAPAEEIAQETMTRAYLHWAKIGDAPTGWCVTVAVNLALDQMRRAERDRRRHRELITLDRSAVADPRTAERLDLYAALRQLPRRQRQIVALRYLGDLTEADTARSLNVTLGTVKSLCARGLATLRKHLTDPIDHEEPTCSNT